MYLEEVSICTVDTDLKLFIFSLLFSQSPFLVYVDLGNSFVFCSGLYLARHNGLLNSALSFYVYTLFQNYFRVRTHSLQRWKRFSWEQRKRTWENQCRRVISHSLGRSNLGRKYTLPQVSWRWRRQSIWDSTSLGLCKIPYFIRHSHTIWFQF